MKRSRIRIRQLSFALLLAMGPLARAEERASPPAAPAEPAAAAPIVAPPPAAPAVTPVAPASAPASAPSAKPKARRSGGEIQGAEGTEAPNRFQADTVIKSQYTIDGQPLEVDPD